MKLSRQEAIKQIIKTQVIETQSDLAEALKKAGFNVTQATVSRDCLLYTSDAADDSPPV